MKGVELKPLSRVLALLLPCQLGSSVLCQLEVLKPPCCQLQFLLSRLTCGCDEVTQPWAFLFLRVLGPVTVPGELLSQASRSEVRPRPFVLVFQCVVSSLPLSVVSSSPTFQAQGTQSPCLAEKRDEGGNRTFRNRFGVLADASGCLQDPVFSR